MTHLSENCNPLSVKQILVRNRDTLCKQLVGFNEVGLLILPPHSPEIPENQPEDIAEFVAAATAHLGPEATLITVGETMDLVHVHAKLASSMQYQLWISIKRTKPRIFEDNSALPNYHFGVLVHTKYQNSLRHTTTRIKYTYCPACDKTTKDYGGKKHTYNSYGTLISDVWRDIAADLRGDLTNIIERFADLFGIEPYTQLRVFDCRSLGRDSHKQTEHKMTEKQVDYIVQPALFHPAPEENSNQSQLLLGDSLEKLRQLPDNTVDFAFADPPYNLKKKYNNYSDDLSITEYFEWCDEWLTELARVLRPGRTCAILNIPLWGIRHFLHMEKILTFQNWIAWDALSFPVRKIMPAHYAILCFSKGPSRPLPGLTNRANPSPASTLSPVFRELEPLDEGFCLRAQCVQMRQAKQQNDRGLLTDLWWDIHRLKHNSRRVDHPCQLPPQLMYRLISIFTEPGEVVLDCFNGAGTTTLAAHQLNRHYIGIELSEKYYAIAASRHEEIQSGIDPFRKVERELTEKNSRVERLPKQVYEVPKKTLQLEVRRVARELGKLPTRAEMIQYGTYPIKYYDEYFVSWGEVCAAARHDGMSEERQAQAENGSVISQPSLFSLEELDAKQ